MTIATRRPIHWLTIVAIAWSAGCGASTRCPTTEPAQLASADPPAEVAETETREPGPLEALLQGSWEANTEQEQLTMVVAGRYWCMLAVPANLTPVDAEAEPDEIARQQAALFYSVHSGCGKLAEDATGLTVEWMIAVRPALEGTTTRFEVSESDGGPELRDIARDRRYVLSRMETRPAEVGPDLEEIFTATRGAWLSYMPHSSAAIMTVDGNHACMVRLYEPDRVEPGPDAPEEERVRWAARLYPKSNAACARIEEIEGTLQDGWTANVRWARSNYPGISESFRPFFLSIVQGHLVADGRPSGDHIYVYEPLL